MQLVRAFVDGVGTDEWQQASVIAETVENFARGLANGMSGENDEKLELVDSGHFIPRFKQDEKPKPATREDTKGIAAFERRIAAKFGG